MPYSKRKKEPLMDKKVLNGLMEVIGYRFADTKLLERSLTHASTIGQPNNERLEFLGDAVLELIVTDYLYCNFPNLDEGEMSRLRAKVVQEDALYHTALRIYLGDYLQLGIGEEKSGGRKKPSILSDAQEALIGALYVDGGIEAARTFVMKSLPEAIEAAQKGNVTDYKTALQERLQENGSIAIEYHITNVSGPDHDRIFHAQLVVDGEVKADGRGRNKKAAEQEAARHYLQKLKK